MTGCVYIVTNTINGTVYVGKSVKGSRYRMNQHIAAARRGEDWAFYRAMRKYGEEAFEITEALLSDSDDELLAAEVALIAEYEEKGVRLYNSTKGGQGTVGRVFSAETKAKIAEKARGRKLTDEHRAKIAARSTRGTVQTAEFKANLSRSKKEYWANRRALGLKGHPRVMTEAGRRSLSEHATERHRRNREARKARP